jgi:hypothetical protein
MGLHEFAGFHGPEPPLREAARGDHKKTFFSNGHTPARPFRTRDHACSVRGESRMESISSAQKAAKGLVDQALVAEKP